MPPPTPKVEPVFHPAPLPGDDELLVLRRPLVAVLPFTAADEDDHELRQLGTQLAQVLRERLATVPALRAILISSEFLERAPEHAVDLVCRQLGIGYMITGQCHRAPTGTSLYLELAETRHWLVRWAKFLRCNAQDLLLPQSDAMTGIVLGLEDTLAPQPVG